MNSHQDRQDREDRLMARILAVGSLTMCGFLLVALVTLDLPDKNEAMLGTVVGFIFGNMVGPVFRKAFGGVDADSRRVQVAQGEALDKAVASLATSAPITDAPQPVLITNPQNQPVPISVGPDAPDDGELHPSEKL